MQKIGCDLAIVGDGLAGMAAAAALRDYPGRLMLIGRQASMHKHAPENRLDQRNVALSENSRRILSDWKVWKTLAAAAAPVHAIHVSEQGSFGVTRIRADEEGVAALGWVVPARRLQQALYESMQKQKNLICKMPATARHLTKGDDQTMASLIVAEANQESRIKAPLLVLADGGQSGLSKQAGFCSRHIDYQQTAIVFNMTVESGGQQCAYERFTKRGLIALLPLAENHCGVVWINSHAASRDLLKLKQAQFRHKLQEIIGDRLGCIMELGPRQSYPLALRWAEKIWRGRVVLLGNAAHTLHPVAAQGFNLSLRDTAFLAEHLRQYRRDPGHSSRQSHYEKQRQRDSRKVMSFTHGLIRFFALPLHPLRGGLLCALDLLPSLRRMIVHGSLGLTRPALPVDGRSARHEND